MRYLLIILLLVAIPLAGATPTVGPAKLISDGPVGLQTPAVGDDYVAWVSVNGGGSDIHARFRGGDDVFALTRSDPSQTSNDVVVAEGPYLAWVRSRFVNLPGEGQVINRDYVVYDIDRQAEIFDSRTEEFDEQVIAIGDGWVGYMTLVDDGGPVQRFYRADIEGRNAFISSAPRPVDDQYQLAMAGELAVLLEASENGQQIVLVDRDGQSTLVAEPRDGVGYGNPTVGDGHAAWVEHVGDQSTIVLHDGQEVVGTWDAEPGTRYTHVAIGDDLVVATVYDKQTTLRTLQAWCFDDEAPTTPGPETGTMVRPAATPWGTVVFLRQVGDAFYVYERVLTCTGVPSEDVPAGFAMVPIALAFFMRRR